MTTSFQKVRMMMQLQQQHQQLVSRLCVSCCGLIEEVARIGSTSSSIRPRILHCFLFSKCQKHVDQHKRKYSTTTITTMNTLSTKKNSNNNGTFDIKIMEVGPRDGLQNETKIVNVSDKVQFIQLLQDAGCTNIEIGSFVSHKAIPTMSNTKQVIQELTNIQQQQKMDSNNSSVVTTTASTTTYTVLVPTMKYLHDALQVLPTTRMTTIPSNTATIKYEIAIFASASESFSQKNLNCSIEESMIRYTDIVNTTKELNIPVRGYLSCTLGCPYEGMISSKVVGQITEQLLSIGVYEVVLSDTIGIGNRTTTKQMIYDTFTVATGADPSNLLAVHFHDTYGQALNNILVALDFGITTIDSSVAGLGGCPYAKGATGNVATEDLVYMLHGMGLSTGIDLDKLSDASQFICNILGRSSSSKAGSAIAAKRQQNSV